VNHARVQVPLLRPDSKSPDFFEEPSMLTHFPSMPATQVRKLLCVAVVGVGCAFGTAAFAADTTHASGSAMAAGGGCNANEAAHDPAACKRESGAAAEEAKRGNLTSPGAAKAERNAADRCASLAGAQKKDCLSRVGVTPPPTGGGTITQGSVQSGGIIKETVTTVPAKP
jgi:hypothetical protein